VSYHRESGQYKGQRHIQGGRTVVRSILYMATLTAIRQNPKLKRFYKHLRGQGKASKIAIIACMHKLLRILNAMIRKQVAFDPI
jgi:transposase